MGGNSFWGPRIAQESVLQQVKARKVDKLGNRAIYSVELDGDDLEPLRNSGDVEYEDVDAPRSLLGGTGPRGAHAGTAHP
ncbi:peptidase S8, partial [Vibrio parahaemolyticus]|nr:peptidase S8 [Vibrio parahaemolyticus]